MVEMLAPQVSPDRALALVGPLVVSLPRSDPIVGQVLADAPFGGLSHEDHLLSDTGEEEASIGLTRRNTRAASKLRFSWLDSLLVESDDANYSGRRLLKRWNVDFLVGEATVVVDIPNDDTPKQSEGMRERATELPREPKEEAVETSTLGENVLSV